MNLKLSIKILLLSLMFMGWASVAFGQLEFHPYLNLEEEYDDNIYLVNDNEVDDWISIVEPGIELNYESRSVELTADYRLRYEFYSENDDNNIDQFEDVQRGEILARLFSGRPFTLEVSEQIAREALDESDVNEDYNDLVNRTTVYRTRVTPEYRWRLGRTFSLLFGYDYERVDYATDAAYDSQEQTGRFSVQKELSSNTSVTANYSYSIYEDDDDTDFDQQTYTLGLNQQLGRRVNLSVEGGVAMLEYESGLDYETSFWQVNASYGLTESLSLIAAYDQDFATTAQDGLTESSHGTAGLAYARNDLTASLEMFWNQLDYLDQPRQEESTGARFEIDLPLSSVFSTTLEADYERATYDQSIRSNILGILLGLTEADYQELAEEQVDSYGAGVALNYEFRRILASLGYRYRHSDSDRNRNDYDNNIATLRFTVAF